MKALLVVDLQRDFTPGGALPVEEGDAIVETINRCATDFSLVIATRDWHPVGHCSFASSYPDKGLYETVSLGNVIQRLWPDHCVAGTKGAEFHPDFDLGPLQAIIHKGVRKEVDSYSAFWENDRRTPTGLGGFLEQRGVRQLFVCGLALDYCVLYSALDAQKAGFRTSVLLPATRGVDQPRGNIEKSLSDMRNQGIVLQETL